MKAAVLNRIPGELEIEDVTLDAPRDNEVLVRVSASGLCHSDLHFMEGLWNTKLPAVMGHEAAGIVEAVGEDVTDFKAGDHVITCLSVFCGKCRWCLAGHLSICANPGAVARPKSAPPAIVNAAGERVAQFARLGAFAEEMVVHEHAVVKIPENMPLDVAALIGCGVTTGLGAVFRTARVEPGSSVAVIGAGGIGLSAIQGARIAGAAKIIAVDVVDHKLDVARQLGATHVVNGAKGDPVEAVKELTLGGVDFSFEAIGLKQTAEQAWAMLAPRGTATIIGMVPFGTKIEIPGHEIFMQEKILRGSMMGSNQFRTDMPRFIDLYLDGRLLLDEMVTGRITLDEVNEGYDLMRRGESTRTVISFEN
ncbi:MAG: zinc-binding dehydrogenase [Acidimicrobiia bacterium]|nr:zinc-binding dehydrogenase [Acidimicrobiia bacterium]